jgi:hypothetical protein
MSATDDCTICPITGEAGQAIHYIMAVNNPVLGLAKIVQIDGYWRSKRGNFRFGGRSSTNAHIIAPKARQSVLKPETRPFLDMAAMIAEYLSNQLLWLQGHRRCQLPAYVWGSNRTR